MKPKPTEPCFIHKTGDWWWEDKVTFGQRVGQWLCTKCHPDPNREVK